MHTVNHGNVVLSGEIILARFDKASPRPLARPFVAALADAHAALAKAVAHADAVRGEQRGVLAQIASASGALGHALSDLGGAIVVARLGALHRPFAAFGGKGLSRYTRGLRSRAAREANELLANMRARTLPRDVEIAVDACARRCAEVEAAYAALGAQRTRFRIARNDRAAALARYVAALADARNIAKVVWRDEPRAYDLVFAPIDRDILCKRAARSAAPSAHRDGEVRELPVEEERGADGAHAAHGVRVADRPLDRVERDELGAPSVVDRLDTGDAPTR